MTHHQMSAKKENPLSETLDRSVRLFSAPRPCVIAASVRAPELSLVLNPVHRANNHVRPAMLCSSYSLSDSSDN